MPFKTIGEMFVKTVTDFGDKPAYGEKHNGQWSTINFNEVKDIVYKFSAGLASLGIKKEDKVAILSGNNTKWALSDFAITGFGAATVAIYPTLIPPQIHYILNNSDSKAVIVENNEQREKILKIMDDLPELQYIISMDTGTEQDGKFYGYDKIMELGEAYTKDSGFSFEDEVSKIQENDLLTLIYTSGTTGDPKGVMLSHKNLASNVQGLRKGVDVNENDVFLSFLPLSHSFERMVGHFTAFSCGCVINYAESIETVADNMGEVRPTVMTSVPRLYEKMYTKVIDKVSQGSAVKQKLFYWAIGVGKQASKFFQRGQQPTGFLKFKFGIANKLVFGKIKERVGGRLRFFASGGAPLSKEIGEFFSSAGITILEGYGLTETSPVITVNRLELFKFGTVGGTIEGVEVKIADDGEILCKGPNVMTGYYKNEAATAEAIDADGWFYTGDIGHLDEDNYLVITDRKKNIIVTSGGKNIAPAPMEISLASSKYIEQSLIIGNNRNFISALIVPSYEVLEAWAVDAGVTYNNRGELLKNPKVKDLFGREIDKANNAFSRYEQIKEIRLIEIEWSIESGEMTPSLKVKRKAVETNYADLINSIYPG